MNQVDPEILKCLIPLNDLSSASRLHLSRLVEVKLVKAGMKLNQKDFSSHLVYLLEGKVEFCDEEVVPQVIMENDSSSQRSLFADASEKSFVSAVDDSQLIFLKKDQFDSLIGDELVMEGDVSASESIGYVETSIYNSILQAIESDSLELPGLPEVALNIKKAIDKDDVTIEDVVRIVKSDPVIVVRLIEVANSVLTRGVDSVKSVHDAILRLGLSMTQNLVISFSVKRLFQTKQKILKNYMVKMYEHSVEISAISFALAKKLHRFDADQLLLVGLIHDIGVIPILKYIDETGLEIHNEEEVENVVKKLRSAVGALVIKKWGFPDEMIFAVEHAENWFKKEPDAVDMADIIIVAQIYSLLKQKKLDEVPDIKKIPVFKKMFAEEPDPEFVMNVLNDAQEIIDEVKLILSVG